MEGIKWRGGGGGGSYVGGNNKHCVGVSHDIVSPPTVMTDDPTVYRISPTPATRNRATHVYTPLLLDWKLGIDREPVMIGRGSECPYHGGGSAIHIMVAMARLWAQDQVIIFKHAILQSYPRATKCMLYY